MTKRSQTSLSMVVTMTQNRVIGCGGATLWNLPSEHGYVDLLAGKEGIIIVGHATFSSPEFYRRDQRHIVMSRTEQRMDDPKVLFVSSVDEACHYVESNGGKGVVVGGLQTYQLFLPRVQYLYVTTVHADVPGDTFFPVDPKRDPQWRPYGAYQHKRRAGDEYKTSRQGYARRC